MIKFIITAIPWNDYGFYTHYNISFKKDDNRELKLGRVLIVNPGEAAKKEESISYENDRSIEGVITELSEDFISIGQSTEYYLNIYNYANQYPELKNAIKNQLRDIVLNETVMKYSNEQFFIDSFTRGSSLYVINNVYPRILETGIERKEYYLKFSFEEYKGKIIFDTNENKSFSKNVYAVIGNNGVGKTRLLQNIVTKISEQDFEKSYSVMSSTDYDEINKILLLSMSTFDNHKNIIDKYKDVKYVGIIDYNSDNDFKNTKILLKEIYENLKIINSNENKKRELDTVLEEHISCFDSYLKQFIKSDILTYKIDDEKIEDESTIEKFYIFLKDRFEELSSGQTNMLYMVFSLIAQVEEGMFAVIDEPELYLHPPYIMGYINLLNYIFDRHNAIAFVATHSPIIVQQLPSDCVYEMKRSQDNIEIEMISFPCYGENIGLITDRIFNVKLRSSGFYKELSEKNFDELKKIYTDENIGIEAKLFIKNKLSERG